MACRSLPESISNDTLTQLGNNCSDSSIQNGTYYFASDDDGLYEVPMGIIILLSIFYGTISVAAVIGNSLVIWIIVTSRRMHNVTHYFIANLALADIVIGLFSIPFQFQAALLQRWNLPYFMCPFCPFIQILSVSVSIFTLTAIAVDRHRAVLKPLSARPSKMRAKIVIAVIWGMGALLGLPMALALRVKIFKELDRAGKIHYRPFCENLNFSDSSMMYYRCILFLLQYVMPLCIISWAYVRMAHRLWDTKVPGNAEGARDANILKNKKKVIKMLVIVVTLFALCWLPLQTYNFLQEIIPEINGYRYINIIWFCFDWLAMSNSCYNPFIYGIYNEKFRREFQIRFPGFRSRHCSPTSYSDSIDMDRTVHSMLNSRTSVRLSHQDIGEWSRRCSSSSHGDQVGVTPFESTDSSFKSCLRKRRPNPTEVNQRFTGNRKSVHCMQTNRRSGGKKYFDLRDKGAYRRQIMNTSLLRECESSPAHSNRSDDETAENTIVRKKMQKSSLCPSFGSKEELFRNDDDSSRAILNTTKLDDAL